VARPPTTRRTPARILILNGADDRFVKREQYDALKKDLDAAKVDYRVIQYPGAVHAFTNPEATELGKKFNLPLRYDAKADQESKAEAAKFFAANLKNKWFRRDIKRGGSFAPDILRRTRSANASPEEAHLQGRFPLLRRLLRLRGHQADQPTNEYTARLISLFRARQFVFPLELISLKVLV
jgi:hypothetical protein